MSSSPLEYTFRGVFRKIAVGHATSAGTAIGNGAQQTLTVTITGVNTDGTWGILAVIPNTTLGGCTVDALVTAANTVTVYIQNVSGASVTPSAQQITVVAGQLDSRFLTL